MGGARVTSVQVAKRAGVSQSAVSRVFTPGASVSKKTADKVKKAADELGYRPNILARSLITGKSRMIAADAEDAASAKAHIAHTSASHEYRASICFSES